MTKLSSDLLQGVSRDLLQGVSNDLVQATLCAYKLQKLSIDSTTCC